MFLLTKEVRQAIFHEVSALADAGGCLLLMGVVDGYQGCEV